jgi:conjugal transfer pilus assembly protein TraL
MNGESAMDEPVKIPRGLDAPPQLLLWQLDELSPVLVGMIVGIATERLIVCLFIGLLMVRFYKKLRDGRPDGFPIHFVYWIGLLPVSDKKTYSVKDSFHRNWVS